MDAAIRAAFFAPLMATVATGTPPGICTMESRESRPFKALDFTGTPITGSVVMAATMPGRWAAPPAPAIMTEIPLSLAVLAYSYIRSGVRCALTTRFSNSIPSSESMSTAPDITS